MRRIFVGVINTSWSMLEITSVVQGVFSLAIYDVFQMGTDLASYYSLYGWLPFDDESSVEHSNNLA